MSDWTPTEWSEFIGAIAALAWPLLVIGIVVGFRRQFRSLLTGTMEVPTPFGPLKFDRDASQKIERQVQLLHRDDAPGLTVEGLRGAVPENPALRPDSDVDAHTERELAPNEAHGSSRALQDEILDLASRDLRVALLKLRAALEDRVRDLAHAWGGMDSHAQDWTGLLDALATKGVVPPGTASNVILVEKVQADLVRGAAADTDALTALDAGIDILVALGAIPIQGYEVVETGVPLYKDRELQEAYEDGGGVIVRQVKPGGRRGNLQGPFPTRRPYEVGDIVGWGWSFREPAREFFWRQNNGEVTRITSAWFEGDRLRRPPALPEDDASSKPAGD